MPFHHLSLQSVSLRLSPNLLILLSLLSFPPLDWCPHNYYFPSCCHFFFLHLFAVYLFLQEFHNHLSVHFLNHVKSSVFTYISSTCACSRGGISNSHFNERQSSSKGDAWYRSLLVFLIHASSCGRPYP